MERRRERKYRQSEIAQNTKKGKERDDEILGAEETRRLKAPLGMCCRTGVTKGPLKGAIKKKRAIQSRIGVDGEGAGGWGWE